jgi:hypothetical protein
VSGNVAAAIFTTVALSWLACGRPPLGGSSVGGPSVELVRRWSVPAPDVGASCADVGDRRICWDGQGQVIAVARAVPAFASPASLGFLCSGQGPSRTCEVRDGAEPFVCEGATCTQRHPRQPDDGEWQCADDSGVTVCTGGERASGVASAGDAPGWICGLRRPGPGGDRAASRVCVDLSPDFPGGKAGGLRCTWSYLHGVERTCVNDAEAHGIGDACDDLHPCVVGARCTGGRCAPPRPEPSCWLDADCVEGGCRLGSCLVAER